MKIESVHRDRRNKSWKFHRISLIFRRERFFSLKTCMRKILSGCQTLNVTFGLSFKSVISTLVNLTLPSNSSKVPFLRWVVHYVEGRSGWLHRIRLLCVVKWLNMCWVYGWVCGRACGCVCDFFKTVFWLYLKKNKAKPLSASAKGPVLNRWLLCLQSYQKNIFSTKFFVHHCTFVFYHKKCLYVVIVCVMWIVLRVDMCGCGLGWVCGFLCGWCVWVRGLVCGCVCGWMYCSWCVVECVV